MSVSLLILLGGIIALGFLGELFFEKTRIPDTLLLMGAGILIGPVFRVIPPETVRPFMPTFGTIALTIILFEGGLNLDLRRTIRQAGRAVLLAVFSFIFTTFLLYYCLVVVSGSGGNGTWAVAAALACTSAPIVMSVAGRVLPDSPMTPLLAVESSVSDALAVMTVLALSGGGIFDPAGSAMIPMMGTSFLIGVASAVAAATAWLLFLGRLHSRKFFYLLTIGFVFLLMGAVEAFHGSGSLTVFVFGLVLANGETIAGLFGSRVRSRIARFFPDGTATLHPGITGSHAEISFLIRSFFFVYLGTIFRWPGTDPELWLLIVLAAVAIVIGRQIAVTIVSWTARISRKDRAVLGSMIPRGLATAVLASMIALESGTGFPSWETVAVFIIAITNFLMSMRLAGFEKNEEHRSREPRKQEVPV